MELENVIEEEQIENCKKITIDTFNLEDLKKDIQLYLKSINFDKDKFILDENREYRIQTKENFTSFLIDYFKDIKENIVFDFKNHMDFDKMSIKECEEKGFRKNIIDYYFNNSLRSLGFHLNLSNEEKLNETLDEHYEDVNDSFISKFEKKTISFFYKQFFYKQLFLQANCLLHSIRRLVAF